MVNLLQVVVASQVDLSMRQSAAIHLKNVVVREWDEDNRGECMRLFCAQ